MKVVCKSTHRSKNAKLWKKRANQRAAKERKRVERLACEEPEPNLSHFPPLRSITAKPSGFRITILCLEDGERVSFRTARDSCGDLSVSATLAGRKVTCLLANYHPAASQP